MNDTRAWWICIILMAGNTTLRAQLDDDKRELFQFGYNQPIEGHAPLSAYAFYYVNIPHFLHTNQYLRVALAPVYLDGELGFKSALGEHTDLGLGVAGGGFGDSYFEIRQGQYYKTESFTGHGAGPSASIYHLFNPGQRVPLYGIVRGEFHQTFFERDSDTAPNFTLPNSLSTFRFRTGLRFGGREPLILPKVAMELSTWYEGQFRAVGSGDYGFAGDRTVEPAAHLFWSRALLTYTLPELQHNFNLSITGGAEVDPDRLSAFRLGGVLPLAAEFPLSLPGYYFQELSARSFALFSGSYTVPLDPGKHWAVTAVAATAAMDFLPDFQQGRTWNSGVGAGLIYHSPSDAWQVMLSYGYGIDAIRDHGRGAHNIGILIQFDLERAHVEMFEPGDNPIRSRGMEKFFQGIGKLF